MPRPTLLPALATALPLFLTACGAATFDPPPPVVLDTCPSWPVAGPAVAAELETKLPPAAAPATWEWLARLSKLRDQLKVCRGQ